MSKYAVVKIQGKQFNVKEGDEILVPKITEKKFTTDVLMLSDDGKLKLGDPYLKNVKVEAKILEELVKGEKLSISRYKAKSRNRKKVGFRPQFTKLQIKKIA